MASSPEATASCPGEPASPAPPDAGLRNRLGEPVPALRTLYLYLTAGCNLACRHCWISPSYEPGGGSGGHLDLGLLEQAIVEAKPLGLTSAKLTGGEPTLHPDFVGLCELLHRHGVS